MFSKWALTKIKAEHSPSGWNRYPATHNNSKNNYHHHLHPHYNRLITSWMQKQMFFHMSTLTDCDIRAQWKWNKNVDKLLLSWCQRDFQNDEQDGKLFNQQLKTGQRNAETLTVAVEQNTVLVFQCNTGLVLHWSSVCSFFQNAHSYGFKMFFINF